MVLIEESLRNLAALNLVPSSTIWRSGFPSRYTMSMRIPSLNRTFSVPKETLNLVGAVLVLLRGSHLFVMSCSVTRVSLSTYSGLARLRRLESFSADGWKNCLCSLTSCDRVKKEWTGKHISDWRRILFERYMGTLHASMKLFEHPTWRCLKSLFDTVSAMSLSLSITSSPKSAGISAKTTSMATSIGLIQMVVFKKSLICPRDVKDVSANKNLCLEHVKEGSVLPISETM